MRTITLLAFLVLSSGCGDDDGAASDAGPRDARVPDSGSTVTDGGDPMDAGGLDAGERDAGEVDAGTDAGPGSPTAVAEIMQAEGTGDIVGTVTFVQIGEDVTVTYALANCPEGMHQTHIHSGTGCTDRPEMGMHWDVPRGEGIPNVVCDAAGNGTLSYTRMGGTPATSWSIGDGTASDIVGLPVIIHGAEPTSDPRIGCGVIELR